MKSARIPRSFGTHDGTFHADEVTACALLLLFKLIDKDKILRSRNIEDLMRCEYICDVGGIYDPSRKFFDHHQLDYQGPLSSAGMILSYLEHTAVITHKEYEFFNSTLVMGVDAHDNGKDIKAKGVATYSHIVCNFTPLEHEVEHAEQDRAFFEAVDFAEGHLRRMLKRYHYTQSCRQQVVEAMAKGHEFLMFENSIPWIDVFFELDGARHPAKFVIMPADHHWKLRGIPPTQNEKMKVRVPLPKEWAGLLSKDLCKISGISGGVFCHKGRFISVWETREDALKALEHVLKMETAVKHGK